MTAIIETNRLRLRKMNMRDKENLLKIFSDPETMRYYPNVKDQEETIRWINWTINNYHTFRVGLWIVEDKHTGEFLGQCGVVPQKIDGMVQMEIGYLFIREKWGSGYATEAAKACRDYGFEKLKVDQLVSIIDPANHASVRVAEKIGMKLDKSIIKWGKDLSLYIIKAR
ncbi:GNAT family N-acetyltransferase [Aquibacillus kalidii]|uniref:GNAT family N-acetyltransferase n=1 Tax=Aquibacillus kalidii TaxID=2762597 RepID=UPI0016442BD9|nr:GNAT family N-acetyltransferase [Aquibacillus kalidii]